MKKQKFVWIAAVLIFSFIYCAPLTAIENTISGSDKPEYANLSIGCGYGIAYGGVGINFEFNPRLPKLVNPMVHKYYSLSLGLGTTPGGATYLFGVRLYPMGRTLPFQPRLSLNYGIVGLLDKQHSDSGDERRGEGVAFGVGLMVKVLRYLSFDVDGLIVVPVDYDIDFMEGGRFRFSAGLHFHL